MNWWTDRKMNRVARRFNASYVNVEKNTTLMTSYVIQARQFQKEYREQHVDVQEKIQKIRELQKPFDEKVVATYDVEYGTSNYAYLNSLLSLDGFALITGTQISAVPQYRILDIGAGSNEFLRFCHSELQVPPNQLVGVDVSVASKEIIQRDGFEGYAGRIETIPLAFGSFDMVLLSYFIDFDSNQKETLIRALHLVRSGGKLVFEGLLPSVFAGATSEMEDTSTFVTRGRSRSEDTQLLCDFLLSEAKKMGKQASIERIALSHRFIRNEKGFNKRPSVFVVLENQQR